jgi:hypothetical protein
MRAGCDRADGFSLIGMLSVIAILATIVSLMASLFAGTNSVWRRGTGQAGAEAAGRAALGKMAHELQYAVADPILSFTVTDRLETVSYGFENNEVYFLSLQEDQEDAARTNRACREIAYWVRPMSGRSSNLFELVRGCREITGLSNAPPDNCYWNREWFAFMPPTEEESAVLARNVAGLRFLAWNSKADLDRYYDSRKQGDRLPLYRYYDSRTQGDRLPLFLDVYLELVPGDAARQIADLANRGLDFTGRVERAAQRFTTRVYFQNRDGYRQR